MTWDQIPGWFDYDQLYDRVVRDVPPGSTLVEVGCWEGRSAAYLATKIRESGKSVRLCCIDNWAGSECDRLDLCCKQYAYEGRPLRDRFRANLAACGVYEMVEQITSDSAEAASLFADGSVWFCFLDADHRRHAVVRDVRAWLPKIAPGGVLAGHDYNREEVESAVREVLGYGPPTATGGPVRPENGNLTCWVHEVRP